jgi:hypothetical protein
VEAVKGLCKELKVVDKAVDNENYDFAFLECIQQVKEKNVLLRIMNRDILKTFQWRVHKIWTHVFFYVTTVIVNRRLARSDLRHLAALTPAEAQTCDANTRQTDEELFELEEGKEASKYYSVPSHNKELIEKPGTIDIQTDIIDNLPLDNKTLVKLQMIVNVFEKHYDEQGFILKGFACDSNINVKYKKMVQDAIKKVRMDCKKKEESNLKNETSWNKEMVQEEMKSIQKNYLKKEEKTDVPVFPHGSKKRRRGMKRKQQKKQLLTAPGAMGHECAGSAKWIALIIEVIAKVIKGEDGHNSPPPSSPSPPSPPSPPSIPRKYFSQEAIVEGGAQFRKTDIEVYNLRPCESVKLSNSVREMGEFKPFSLKNEDVLQLLASAKLQAIAHAAKKLYFALKFGEYGCGAYSTMCSGTMASVKVQKLFLENVRSPDAGINYKESLHLPLMKAQSFDKFVETSANSKHESVVELRKEMYGQDGKGGMYEKDGFQIPYGIIVYYYLLTRKGDDESSFGLDIDFMKAHSGGGNEVELGEVLGTGLHSVVFKRGVLTILTKP